MNARGEWGGGLLLKYLGEPELSARFWSFPSKETGRLTSLPGEFWQGELRSQLGANNHAILPLWK